MCYDVLMFTKNYRAGALVLWLKEETHNQNVISLNPAPDTGWTFFTIICCKIVMFVC